MTENARRSLLIRFTSLLLPLTMGLIATASATNAVPWVQEPLTPTSAAAGGSAFTLYVFGVGFGKNARLLWNGSKRTTTYITSQEVIASISAADIAKPGTATIQVQNDTPGGGYSNVVNFPIGVSKTSLTGVISAASSGSGAGWPAVGDFNKDGKLDVASVNMSANTVSVFLGNGDATFQPHVDYSVGTQPWYIVTGDFNDDGNLDLAVANKGGNNVSILLGNGDGTFRPATNFAAGNSPTAVATADFNHDGKLDLVLPNPADNTISVLLGNGNGTFGVPLTATTGAYPVHVAVADFDLDGKMDVVVADENCATPPCGMGSISVLRGNGDGTFRAKHDFQSNLSTGFVAVANFNRDGAPDVVAVNSEVFDTYGTVGYFRNMGAGTFAAPVEYTTGQASTAVVVGDFNNDGKLDMAVLNSEGSNLTLEFGNNDGTFGNNGITYSNFNFFGGPIGLAVGDFNNDGQLDFVSSDNNDNELDILTQQPAPAGVTLTATSLNFGVQPVEQVSPTQKVTLTNSGGVALSISSIAVSPSQFLESNTCPSSLASGLNCTISIAFDPTAFKNYQGTVTINDNASTSPQTISLSGVGTLTQYSPASLNFGTVAVGSSSSLPVTLTNLSVNTINVSTVKIVGSGIEWFSQTNNCRPTLAGKSSCTITVTFTPTSTGVQTGTLSVSTSGGPQTQINLMGTGQ